MTIYQLTLASSRIIVGVAPAGTNQRPEGGSPSSSQLIAHAREGDTHIVIVSARDILRASKSMALVSRFCRVYHQVALLFMLQNSENQR